MDNGGKKIQVIVLDGERLEKFKTALAKDIFGMTKEEAIAQGICISCKETPKFSTEEDERQYQISGLCEKCFNEIMQGL